MPPPDCPANLLRKLVEDKEAALRQAAYRNPQCPERLMTVRVEIGKSVPQFNAELLEIACLHGNASLDLLLRLIDKGRFDTSICTKIFNNSAQRDTSRDLYRTGRN